MPKKTKYFGKIPADKIDKVLSEAYLNIYVDEEKIFNPLMNMPEEFEEAPEGYIAWLMMQPSYFHFICRELLNIELFPLQIAVIKEIWNRKFPMLIASRGFSKSFSSAVYGILRGTILQPRKVVICGAAFRQSKIIFEYMENIWNNAPVFRDMMSGNPGRQGPFHQQDLWRFYLGESTVTALPIGDGGKIRGQRANDALVDEFAALNKEIFETVIAGFGAVAANPVENMKFKARQKMSKNLGIEIEDVEAEKTSVDNQIVISGTAFYDFNHFADYWKKWKEHIMTGGDPKKIAAVFNKHNPDNPITPEDIPPGHRWDDYSVMRIPYELIPEGLLDSAQVARARASIDTGTYMNEYGAVFSSDSSGFFRRSLIERATCNYENKIEHPSGEVFFKTVTHGNPSLKYVYGIDPAAESDNFAIVVLECHRDHRRVVYCWTTNKKIQKEKFQANKTNERDYYSYCARKIRLLMNRFPCAGIALDVGGGGTAIMERLNDEDKIKQGEQFIWPLIDPSKTQDTDKEAGLHIILPVQFSNGSWTETANHALKSDIENKICVFPFFDSVELAYASTVDDEFSTDDPLEEAMLEIEDLKTELTTIIITQLPSGRYRWDTPQVKQSGNKVGRLVKDRYSALLMANDLARRISEYNPEPIKMQHFGGFAKSFDSDNTSGPAYTGPARLVEKLNSLYD